jgi:L-alanine-DL-glutamate epimerase-like enolase superfamily enzyme
VFAAHDEAEGNRLMFRLTQFALREAEAVEWETPLDLLDRILPSVWEHGRAITGRPDLRLTFVLNALVPVDIAAWLLHSRQKGVRSFDEMIPAPFRAALPERQKALASIPLVPYDMPMAGIERLLDEGSFLLKIKIGANPDGDGDRVKMLEWDKNRISEIHRLAKGRSTACTGSGRIVYYLDANGRYDSLDRLIRLLDHAERIGALERIVLLEEPFPESAPIDVRDLPVRVAADESAHSDRETRERIDMGYQAIALKPAGKTVSMSLRIARAAKERGMPCFCADLTVNPALVEWNKNFAARLSPIPGLETGVLEINGHQNYKNWETMRGYHPCPERAWQDIEGGLIALDEDFYSWSGGVFQTGRHYRELVVQNA